MRKQLFLVFCLCWIGLTSLSQAETLLNFESDDPSHGLANARMSLVALNNTTLQVTLKNESPVSLDGGINLPAITGFGFDLNEGDLTLAEWTLSAYEYDCDNETLELRNLAGNQSGIDYLDVDWALEESAKSNKIRLDFYANSDRGVNNALYNPDAAVLDESAFSGNTHFFTDAVLTLTFDQAFSIPTAETYADPADPTAMVRMQNTALCGEESLKLFPLPPFLRCRRRRH